MKYEISVSGLPDFILVTINENIDPYQIETILNNVLKSGKWEKGIGIIFDYSTVSLNCFSVSNIDFYCGIAAKYKEKLKDSFCAIIVNDSTDFTVVNIFETLADIKSNHRVRIFYDTEDAKNWLKNKKPVSV